MRLPNRSASKEKAAKPDPVDVVARSGCGQPPISGCGNSLCPAGRSAYTARNAKAEAPALRSGRPPLRCHRATVAARQQSKSGQALLSATKVTVRDVLEGVPLVRQAKVERCNRVIMGAAVDARSLRRAAIKHDATLPAVSPIWLSKRCLWYIVGQSKVDGASRIVPAALDTQTRITAIRRQRPTRHIFGKIANWADCLAAARLR
jgi:hypothetical protein